MDLLKSLFRRPDAIARKDAGGPTATARRAKGQPLDQYETGLPTDQMAIDLLPGWNCSFPEEFGLTAGSLGLFHDARILWALERFGSIEGKTVLEIGPLEGMHTHMLNQRRPARIDAIEANRLCYLRCLVAGQILDLDRAKFYLGNVLEWLERRDLRYDLIVASGVLYHMADPANLLRLASMRTDALFLWTHFYLEEAMPPDDPRRKPFSGRETTVEVSGVKVRCFERSYKNTTRNASFCGGMNDRHYWLHRDDILALLPALGYTHIDIGSEDLGHPGGPCFSLMARRTPAAGTVDIAVQP